MQPASTKSGRKLDFLQPISDSEVIAGTRSQTLESPKDLFILSTRGYLDAILADLDWATASGLRARTRSLQNVAPKSCEFIRPA